jgi:hypothetical protein
MRAHTGNACFLCVGPLVARDISKAGALLHTQAAPSPAAAAKLPPPAFAARTLSHQPQHEYAPAPVQRAPPPCASSTHSAGGADGTQQPE